MNRSKLVIPVIGAGSAFGAAGAVLALMGAGVPFLMAALGASVASGIVLWAAMPRPGPAGPDPSQTIPADPAEARAAILRHDLRGALSPALMVSDRLIAHPDPAVSRAGAVVIRSIEKATAVIAASNTTAEPVADP